MTDSMTHIHATQASFPSRSQVFSGILTTWCDRQRSVSQWSAWRREASVASLVYRCRERSGVCRGCARMATWRRATSGDVARRLVCVCHVLACFVSHLSKRALFVGPMVKKTGARSCRITDQRLDCSRAVLHSRQCLQTSAGVWNRRAADGRKHCKNEGARNFEKIRIFTMCHFPQVRSTFFNDDVSNDMHFLSIHWVIFYDFL